MSRIQDKINQITKYLAELNEIKPETFEDYLDLTMKAACERYVEKIAESVTDLAFLVIKNKRLEIPGDDSHSFDILQKHRIISDLTREKVIRLKGLRNVLAHQYGSIDDEIVFDVIINQLSSDVKLFLSEITKTA